jgi:hypothetical protein
MATEKERFKTDRGTFPVETGRGRDDSYPGRKEGRSVGMMEKKSIGVNTTSNDPPSLMGGEEG